MPKNILLYDDHPFVTESVASYLKKNTDVHVVNEIHTHADVYINLKMNNVDILVSDVLSDENAGFDLFEHVTKNYPNTKIVIYSSISNDFIIQSLLDIGVSTFVNKKETLEFLWQKIKEAFEKDNLKRQKAAPSVKLTSREKEIVSLLSKGLAAKEIANILGSSPNTINNQKNALLEKFNCLNSIDLVVKLSQMGLIGII